MSTQRLFGSIKNPYWESYKNLNNTLPVEISNDGGDKEEVE